MSDWAHLEGIDPGLVQAIEQDGDETVWAFLVLRLPSDEPARPRLEDYPTYDEWHVVLREQDAAWVQQATAPTMEALRQIGLDPEEGPLPFVWLRGTPRQMRQAVALPGVRLATRLDFTPGYVWEDEDALIAASKAAAASQS